MAERRRERQACVWRSSGGRRQMASCRGRGVCDRRPARDLRNAQPAFCGRREEALEGAAAALPEAESGSRDCHYASGASHPRTGVWGCADCEPGSKGVPLSTRMPGEDLWRARRLLPRKTGSPAYMCACLRVSRTRALVCTDCTDVRGRVGFLRHFRAAAARPVYGRVRLSPVCPRDAKTPEGLP